VELVEPVGEAQIEILVGPRPEGEITSPGVQAVLQSLVVTIFGLIGKPGDEIGGQQQPPTPRIGQVHGLRNAQIYIGRPITQELTSLCDTTPSPLLRIEPQPQTVSPGWAHVSEYDGGGRITLGLQPIDQRVGVAACSQHMEQFGTVEGREPLRAEPGREALIAVVEFSPIKQQAMGQQSVSGL